MSDMQMVIHWHCPDPTDVDCTETETITITASNILNDVLDAMRSGEPMCPNCDCIMEIN